MRVGRAIEVFAALVLALGVLVQVLFLARLLERARALPRGPPSAAALPGGVGAAGPDASDARSAHGATAIRLRAAACADWGCLPPRQGRGGAGSASVPASPRARSAAGIAPRASATTDQEGALRRRPSPPSPSAAPSTRAAAEPPAGSPPSSGHSDVDFFCANRAAAAERDRISRTSMTEFIATGGRFPVVVVTKNRAAMLRETLASLLGGGVRCISKDDVFVVQDGDDAAVTSVLTDAGVRYEQSAAASRQPNAPPPDGAASIAAHYRFALGRALAPDGPLSANSAPPPGVIVVEDDFRFAPDFYEYFHAVAPAIEADPTLWLASAWNDNGFDYLVADPTALRRTGYFPGLGWLLPLAVWTQELAATWPANHWDHWMRDPSRGRGRDIIIPEVPRDYHAGVRGTFMDAGTHNKYFGSIAMQADAAFTWDTPEGARAIEGVVEPAYTARLEALLAHPDTVHVTSIAALRAVTAGTAVLWYSCPTGENDHTSMRPLAAFFGIWHEGARGSRGGVHELWWLGSARLLLINVWEGGGGAHVSGGVEAAPALRRFMPADAQPLAWSAFHGVERPVLHTHEALFGAHLVSPLAHLQGGDDANGPPDAAVSVPAGAARLLPPPPAPVGAAHEHARFLSDLTLPRAAAPK